MGRRKMDRITDYVREGYNLRVTCLGCGHVRVLCSRTLMVFPRPGKNDRLDVIERQLKCGNCRARKAAIQPTARDPDGVN
ncbi:MAG: hypothetical protein ACO1OX_07835 [Novosphingobium sp.]